MDLFTELNASGRTIVLITHDPDLAGRCSRVLRIEEGRFQPEEVAA